MRSLRVSWFIAACVAGGSLVAGCGTGMKPGSEFNERDGSVGPGGPGSGGDASTTPTGPEAPVFENGDSGPTGCVPKTCVDLGNLDCGSHSDGCGGIVVCGSTTACP